MKASFKSPRRGVQHSMYKAALAVFENEDAAPHF